MRFLMLGSCVLLATIVLFGSACSSRQGADYTVAGSSSIYEKTDSRVFVDKPAVVSLRRDGLHDLENDALASLQEPETSMSAFPIDRRGSINWVKALADGVIDPRASRDGDEDMIVMDMDILLKKTGQMPWVRFPHLAHTRWLDCSNCHPAIFIPQKGGNPGLGMDAIIAGQYCGRCHDKVAFPLWTCERCHSVPHEDSPKLWFSDPQVPWPASEAEKERLRAEYH